MARTLSILTVLGLASLLGGCAAPEGPTQLDVAAGQYDATFDAARRVLRDSRFDLERVDAGEGVITTQPKHSAGLVTPWDSEQSTFEQEIDDLTHNQRRVVRVTFEPVRGSGAAAQEVPADSVGGPATETAVADEDGPVDLRFVEGPLRMSVRVTLLRDYKPGLQVQTSSIKLNRYTFDPALNRRGMLPDHETAIDEDRYLAAWLTKEIGLQVGKQAAAE